MDIQVNKQLPVITINFEEVKANLIENTEKYKGLIVTEEGLKDCKATQKELAGLRNKLDTYRKDVKKEMEKPIKEFEVQCKELISLIEGVERPIKIGISEFDDKRREIKRMSARATILDFIKDLGLEEKYASQLTVLDKYLNLSASAKSIVGDIEQRASILKQQQNADKAKAEMLKATIETTLEAINKTIKIPLEYKNFERYIEYGWDIARIAREINNQADLVRKSEQPKEESRKEIEVQVDLKPKESVEVKETKEYETLFFVDVHVEHNYEAIQALSKFLKDSGYKYMVHNKGIVK